MSHQQRGHTETGLSLRIDLAIPGLVGLRVFHNTKHYSRFYPLLKCAMLVFVNCRHCVKTLIQVYLLFESIRTLDFFLLFFVNCYPTLKFGRLYEGLWIRVSESNFENFSFTALLRKVSS